MASYGIGPRGYGGGPPRPPGLPGTPEEDDLYGLRLEDFLPPEQIQPETQPVSRGDQILALLGQSMQGTEMPAPQGFGQGLLSGLFRGLGGEGLRRQGERQKLDQAAQQRAQARNAANLEASRAYRTARVGAVQERGKEARAGATKQADYERDNPKLTPEQLREKPWLARVLDSEGRLPRASLGDAFKPEKVPRAEAEPLEKIEGPDGPVFVRRSEAIGKRPARESARTKPVTGSDRQALAYFNRAKDAIGTIGTTDRTGRSLEERMAGLGQQLGLQYAPNLLKSPDQRSYRQAQRAFTEARLRKESGAAIPPHEYEADAATYFAQPGDDEATINQKRKARDVVLTGLAVGSGPAFEEFYGEEFSSGEVVRGPDGKLTRLR